MLSDEPDVKLLVEGTQHCDGGIAGDGAPNLWHEGKPKRKGGIPTEPEDASPVRCTQSQFSLGRIETTRGAQGGTSVRVSTYGKRLLAGLRATMKIIHFKTDNQPSPR